MTRFQLSTHEATYFRRNITSYSEFEDSPERLESCQRTYDSVADSYTVTLLQVVSWMRCLKKKAEYDADHTSSSHQECYSTCNWRRGILSNRQQALSACQLSAWSSFFKTVPLTWESTASERFNLCKSYSRLRRALPIPCIGGLLRVAQIGLYTVGVTFKRQCWLGDV